MNTENSKMNEPNIFVLNLSQRLDLKGADKRATLQNLSVYYTWKNRTKQYKNNKLKVLKLKLKLQRGMMNLNSQTVLIAFQIFQITLFSNISLKNKEH